MTVEAPHQSYTVWKICITILHCIAIIVSGFRTWLRYRSGRMWWDDYFVVLPVLFDIFCCIALFVAPTPDLTFASISKASCFWLGLFPSFTVAWLSRICFLLLLARLFPPRHVYRRITMALTVIFSLTYLTCFALSVPRCHEINPVSPLDSPGQKQCEMLPKSSARLVFALTAELLSDVILVVWPFLMLYKVKLSQPKDRPLVMISLGCSIFTFPLVLVIFIFNFGPFTQDLSFIVIVIMLAQMTAAVSLIACSMPVVACAAYRTFQKTRGVLPGANIAMPDTSTAPNPVGKPMPELTSSSYVSKGTTSGDTRLTYDDLTRISLSFELSEVRNAQTATN